MCSKVPSWNPPNMLLLRAIRSNSVGEAELQLNPAIDYYRKQYLGSDRKIAGFELLQMVHEIQQRSGRKPDWNGVIERLQSAVSEFKTRN